MPTGAGKTTTASAIIKQHLKKKPDGCVLFCAHREELVAQAYDDLLSWGLLPSVIQANPDPLRVHNPHRRVQVASTQTILSREIFPKISLLVLDEFHHYASDKWEVLGSKYKQMGVPIIGLTATPIRGDGRGFEGLVDELICPISMRELIEQGFLVPYELVVPDKTLRSDQIVQSPVDAYLEHAKGRKAIVFAGNVKAAYEFASQFENAGIRSSVVHGAMDAGERRRVLEDYKSGKIRVLANVGVLTEGFDDPSTSCVILARAIGTLALYLQICGRALRVAPGKTDAIIIDLHGSSRVHGEPAEDREWTLEGRGIVKKNLEQPTERFCPVCGVYLESGAGNICELCGIARPEAGAPEVVGGRLVRYARKLRESPEIRRVYFEKLKGIARVKGYNKWQPHAKYKAIYGEKPPREWW